MAEQPGLEFAGLLRQLRAEAKLTQEELAEAAGLSPRSVSDLERGIHRTAHKDTAGLLARALGLAEPARALFVAAARGRGQTAEVLAVVRAETPGAAAAAATRTLPRDSTSFIGRERELARLLEALAPAAADGGVVGIHAIDGMAGIGKTTLAVHAAHRLAAGFPDGQFFLPLHAHSAGQRPVDPADALASLLLTAGLPPEQIPPGVVARAARWRGQVAGKKVLLLLDDATSHDQVRPLLPGTAGSMVLVTSRRRLTALQDATVISLDILSPPEAAVLLARLAARPDVRASDAAVSEITRLCGYLPLAIGMLASQLRHHPTWSGAALAADLAAARDRLALMRAENVSVGAAFGLSYSDLTAAQQRLFGRLGLHPGSSIDAYSAAALDGISLAAARHHLNELYDQHLLAEPSPGRYQLHDLLREHARVLAAADNPAESAEAIGRLLDYYVHTARAAGVHFARPPATRRPPLGRLPAEAPDVSTLRQASAWLDAERADLHAAADYAASCGRHQPAIAIPAAMSGFLTARGHWDQSVALHQSALTAARQAGDRLGEAGTLTELGVLQGDTGNYPAAAATLAKAVKLYGDAGDLPGQAYALNQLGYLQVLTGDYPAAAASTQRSLALARSAGDCFVEADALIHLGLVQQLTGDYPAAAASQQQALALSGDLGDVEGQAEALSCLGAVQQETGDYPAAAASQQRALALFGDLGNLEGQAYALNELGIVQQETGDYPAAAASHQQALALFRDLGNRRGQAEALNHLGELSSRTSAPGQARERHTQALAIARDISTPLEEARALEGLGQAHLQDGSSGQAAAQLSQALALYRRIGAPAGRRVQETIQKHGLTSITPEPHLAAPDSERHQRRAPTAPPIGP
jgi:tetratricopeptide (TPR) repeat protein/transcriptional regulator with XRE-family HTH domain